MPIKQFINNLKKILSLCSPVRITSRILNFNGRSHIKASLMGPSLCLPVTDGNLINGTWQQLVFIELDTKSRKRKIIIKIVGE